MTHTLSDYPLLIGEILRRDHLRARQQAKLRAIFSDLQRALGMRVARPLVLARPERRAGLGGIGKGNKGPSS
jgi:hypothetical protein